jgi:hypothetical protein
VEFGGRARQRGRHIIEHVEKALLSWDEIESEQCHAASLQTTASSSLLHSSFILFL